MVAGVLTALPAITSAPASAATASPGAFVSIPQRELINTHTGYGTRRAKVAGHSSLTVQMLGRAAIPTAEVAAVRINLTAFDADRGGSIVIAGEPVVSFAKGGLVTNGVVVRPDAHGRFVITNSSADPVDVSASAFGYYRAGTVTAPGMFHATKYAQVVNTTNGLGAPKHLVASGRTLTITIAGHASVPSTGAGAVVLNLSSFNAAAKGTAVAYQGDLGVPTTPSLIYRSGAASRSLVTVPVAPNGTIKILNRGPGAVDISATVEGYYRSGIPMGAGALVNHRPAVTQNSPVSIGAGGTVTTDVPELTGDAPSGIYLIGVYVSGPSESGAVTLWTNGSAQPALATISFTAGDSRYLEVPVRTNTYLISLHNSSRERVHVIVEERGFFSNGQVGAITGTVTDSSGHPLPGVRVTVGDQYSATQFQTTPPVYTTGANGTYQIVGLSPGSYAVCFDPSNVSTTLSATGFQPRCYNGETQSPDLVTVSAGQVAAGIDQALPSGGALTGHVTDTSGHPLAGISVQATVSSNAWEAVTVTTRSDGSFRFNGLDASAPYYTICPITGLSTSPGSVPAGYVGSCGTVMAQAIAGTSTDVGTITMYPAVGVSGTVTDAGGHPLKNVGVGVGVGRSGETQPLAWTDSQGRYRITGIDPMAPPNTESVYVCFEVSYFYPRRITGGTSTTGYVGQCYKNQVPHPQSSAPSSTPINPAAGTVATHIDGHLPPAAAITGTVTNSAGHPLQGITVDVSTQDLNRTTTWETASTAANGTYRIDSLQPGTYSVCYTPAVSDPPSRYVPQCWPHLPPNGAPENVTLSAGQTKTHVDASMYFGGGISGVVTDSGGHPLSGVTVYTDYGTRDTTDSNGAYAFTDLQPGTYSVCFDATSATGGSSTTGYQSQCWHDQPYATSPSNVTVSIGHTTTGISPSLVALGGLAVHVTDTSGNPLSGAPITVYVGSQTSNGSSYYGTGADGNYLVTRLSDGQYTVCITNTSGISGGTSTTGYQAQCYGQTTSTPSAPITISSGNTVPITIALPAN
jgi:protocatechuate 3,4-dioxygenase beta subunit